MNKENNDNAANFDNSASSSKYALENNFSFNFFRDRTLSDVDSLIIIQSRIRYGERFSAVKGFCYEYFRHTSIHGLRYIFSVHRPFYERIFWFICAFVSFYFAILMSWRTFIQWQEAPVIVSFDETLVPVHKIPFPTITICPEIKMEQFIYNFTEISESLSKELEDYGEILSYNSSTQEDIDNFAALLQICDDEVIQKFRPYIPKNAQLDVAQTLVDLATTKNATAPFCKWNSEFLLCTKIFNLVATSEGICYQFNGLRAEDVYRNLSEISFYDTEILDHQSNTSGSWSPENGYINQGYFSYPKRTVFSAIRNAFFAFLQGHEHNVEYACRNVNQGYRVFINSPESVPLTWNSHIFVAREEEVIISVLPQFITADKSLRDFLPEKRQCYFNDERHLRYFQHYSQSNCHTECLTNFTITQCGCAKFWMPKPIEVPVCQISDILCANQAKIELERLQQDQTMRHSMDPNYVITCNCMPSCTSLEYNVEISRARYDVRKTWQAWRDDPHDDSFGSRLCVFFKETQFTAIRRTVLYNLTSFLANCGGILGLFIGFSGLSLVELFYFVCLRSCGNLQKRRRSKKKLQMFNEKYQ